jgi:hypothetical protein
MSSYTTVIESNGSKWAGQAPDHIEKLYEVLQSYTLNPVFEKYGDFWFWAPSGDHQPAMLRFWGNFFELSHVFSIDTNDPCVIEQLTTLIINNKCTPAYQEARRQVREDDERKAREEQRLMKRRRA